MPVTAKLSKQFYDKFGNAVVDELVNWFNQIDATYKGELRELNDLNWARMDAKFDRLDAKLEQRTAELRAEFHAGMARLEGGLLARIGMVEGRLARLTVGLWLATMGTITALLKL
jgi:hypothetical protein